MAEHALGLIVALTKDFLRQDNHIRKGLWDRFHAAKHWPVARGLRHPDKRGLRPRHCHGRQIVEEMNKNCRQSS
ncbi:hypothetical protein QEZ47_18055 [Aminobacter anthyllidis]|uniref:hypothetical protein n=1 Tax=Aminobacter anthyllidis TaxID=1035067 RepID=UPI002458A8A8|nr:hypothetical protein [Aminobacter anthyllidis]MDH4987388.1 hypothetical protein [Aminobacter anthyllidis]